MNRNYNALILKSVKITAGAILAILFASFLNLKYSATAAKAEKDGGLLLQ